MCPKTLELRKVFLTLASEKLKLEISSNVDIRFPSGWSHSLDNDGIVKALTSGSIWVSRGRRCRVDVEISFNGRMLDTTSRITMLESLGYHLRDAQLWSQLSLSTSLEIPQSYRNAESSKDFSIYINHAISSAETQPKAWLLDNIDIKPPESVLCAEFERLHFQLRFHQIQKKPWATSKRVKSSLPESNSPDTMLLDYISGLEDDVRIRFFENVSAVLPEDLSNSIAERFHGFKINGSDNSPKRLDKSPSSFDEKAPNQKGNTASSTIALPQPARRRKGRRFPKEAVEKMQAWLDAHPENTYATNAELLELMKQTSLEKSQIRNWFCDARKRKKSKKDSLETNITTPGDNVSPPSDLHHEEDDDMLLSQFGDEMVFDYDPNTDEMLLSQTTSLTTPSLTSQPSTISTISLTNSLKRGASDEVVDFGSTSISLRLTPANKLTSFALRTVIAGTSNRKRDLRGIQIRKPLPSTNLSALAPSMFSPGFKELMAHNSKFLSTISHAICSSWMRSVQGVVLRRRLIALSNAKISEFHDGDGEEGSTERLTSVVQGRLWRMMQRTLYDEEAVKKLWKNHEGPGAKNVNMNEERCEDEDLLGENGGLENIDKKADQLEDYIVEEFMDDDEELLFGDHLVGGEDQGSDDGLLEYLEEQERLVVEAETEEMFF